MSQMLFCFKGMDNHPVTHKKKKKKNSSYRIRADRPILFGSESAMSDLDRKLKKRGNGSVKQLG